MSENRVIDDRPYSLGRDRHGKKHDIYIHKTTGLQLPIERHWSQEVRKGLLSKLKKQIGF